MNTPCCLFLRGKCKNQNVVVGIKQVQLKEGSCVQVPGSGISGIIEGANVRIGTKAFVQAESSVEEKPERKFDRLDRTSEASSSQTSDQTQAR